jgi:soluble lytic murein transglycosylase-like protein
MNVRQKTLGTDGPGSRQQRAPLRLYGRRWVPLLTILLLGAPTPAVAFPDSLAPGMRGPALADTSQAVQPLRIDRSVPAPNTWELIRESSQRILSPDTRILRYTARYPVSPELARKISEIAVSEGIDPELAFRLVRVESRFQPRARSPVGALGLMQLMPSTARRLDRSLRSEADILEPRTNLRLGMRYLRTMIERYDDVRLGLLAYNRGPVAVDRALRRGQDPENGYSRHVLGTRTKNPYSGPGLLRKAEQHADGLAAEAEHSDGAR